MNIGKKIKRARLLKGYTQEQLGEIIGVQKSAIAKYENGRVVKIKRSILQKIAKELNIRPSELIFEDTPEMAAALHAKIILDVELMEVLKVYYSFDDEIQKDIRDYILIKKGL